MMIDLTGDCDDAGNESFFDLGDIDLVLLSSQTSTRKRRARPLGAEPPSPARRARVPDDGDAVLARRAPPPQAPPALPVELSPVAPPAVASKPKGKPKKLTDEERIAQWLVLCHGALLDGVGGQEVRAGLESTGVPATSVRLHKALPEASATFVHGVQGDTSQHLAVLRTASDLWPMLEDATLPGHAAVAALVAWAASISHAAPNKRVTLCVMGMEPFAASWIRSARRHNAAARKTECVERFEEGAVALQAMCGWNVRFCGDARAFGHMLGTMARTVALHSNDGSTISVAMPNYHVHAAIGKGKKSDDAREVWTGMLVAVPGVSRSIAAAIVQEYPTCRDLLDTYRRRDVEGTALLADIVVAGSKKGRRVGPVLSERVHAVLTGRDGTRIIKE